MPILRCDEVSSARTVQGELDSSGPVAVAISTGVLALCLMLVWPAVCGCQRDLNDSRENAPREGKSGEAGGTLGPRSSQSKQRRAEPDAAWGAFTGRFVYTGDPEAQAGSAASHLEQDLIVDATGGISNVVVWLSVENDMAPPVHRKLKSRRSEMRITDGGLDPRVIAVEVNEPLTLVNVSKAAANPSVLPPRPENEPINSLITPGQQITHSFAVAENNPLQVRDNVHQWKGVIVVKDHRYVAVSRPDGSFMLDMPAGEWRCKVWHERSGALQNIDVNIRRGETTDLGIINVDPGAFK